MIVLDASGVPDTFSGERTRLRGLLEAYARIPDAPALLVLTSRHATLLQGTKLGAIRVEEIDRPGGPRARALKSLRAPPLPVALARELRLWHSETIPPLCPRGVPSLLTLHDLRWHERHEATGGAWLDWAVHHAAARLWLPRVVRRCAGVVTVSRATKRQIVARLGVADGKVSVVANAVDAVPPPDAAKEQAICTALALEPRRYFAAVGRLEARKGLELVVDAMAAATPASALASAQLVLVGEGPARDELAARARRLGARFVLAGRRDDVTVAALIGQAAALLFPSRVEGFGFPVYEALARGTPALASDLPCLAELAALAPKGLTLLPRDRATWSVALERTLAGAALPAPRASLPANLPTWDDAAAALVELYQRTAFA